MPSANVASIAPAMATGLTRPRWPMASRDARYEMQRFSFPYVLFMSRRDKSTREAACACACATTHSKSIRRHAHA